MKVLILGATGMLGYSLFSNLSDYGGLDVFGTVRNLNGKEAFFDKKYQSKIFQNIDIDNIDALSQVLDKLKPDVVINCVGLIKQHKVAKQHVNAISINSLLPHQLAAICDPLGIKLIHFSTDCVFSGSKGNYSESDVPDAQDLYGKSKCLGEVTYEPHLTIRTSIIGHELTSNLSLVDWFLNQSDSVDGFSKAIFSGIPTCFIAKVIAMNILPKKNISGLYHLSAAPIDKYSLLELVASIYQKKIEIGDSTAFVIDRSLNSNKLRSEANIDIPSWAELVREMYIDYKNRYEGYSCKN